MHFPNVTAGRIPKGFGFYAKFASRAEFSYARISFALTPYGVQLQAFEKTAKSDLQHFQPQPVNSLFSPHIPPFLPVFTPYIPKHAPCRTFVRLRHSSYEPSSPLFSSFPKAPKKHLFRSQFSNAFISTVFYRAKIDPVCFYFAKIEVCNRIYAQESFLFLSLDGFRLPSTV